MKRNHKKHAPIANKAGFTLIEVMIVVLIISMLLSVAVPNFIRTREQARAKSCSTNLKQIDGAKEQWAINNRKNASDAAPTFADLAGTGLYLKSTPTCPSGGAYTIGVVGTLPICNRNNPPLYPHTYNGLQ